MSVDAFRTFQVGRPDGERWELIDGRPIMMPPPTILHQVIASNLSRQLDAALADRDEELVVIQAPGVNLGLTAEDFQAIGRKPSYAPEPDVAVLRFTGAPDERFASSVILFAEVVSSTDETAHAEGRAWIEVKAELYRAHRDCQAVLVIEQDRVGIHLWQRDGDGWGETFLADLDAELAIACCGLRCRVRDLYWRTHLSRQAPPR
jgi:Uma2 family endonuclease